MVKRPSEFLLGARFLVKPAVLRFFATAGCCAWLRLAMRPLLLAALFAGVAGECKPPTLKLITQTYGTGKTNKHCCSGYCCYKTVNGDGQSTASNKKKCRCAHGPSSGEPFKPCKLDTGSSTLSAEEKHCADTAEEIYAVNNQNRHLRELREKCDAGKGQIPWNSRTSPHQKLKNLLGLLGITSIISYDAAKDCPRMVGGEWTKKTRKCMTPLQKAVRKCMWSPHKGATKKGSCVAKPSCMDIDTNRADCKAAGCNWNDKKRCAPALEHDEIGAKCIDKNLISKHIAANDDDDASFVDGCGS